MFVVALPAAYAKEPVNYVVLPALKKIQHVYKDNVAKQIKVVLLGLNSLAYYSFHLFFLQPSDIVTNNAPIADIIWIVPLPAKSI